jgi:hypothetical protein
MREHQRFGAAIAARCEQFESAAAVRVGMALTIKQAHGGKEGGRRVIYLLFACCRVAGNGKISVDFKNMPRGVTGTAEGEGLFKTTEITRQTAREGPSAGEVIE